MIKQKVTLSNKLGLHARAAVKLINLANHYQSQILIEHRGRQVNAKDILCVMALGVTYGTEIELIADGEDELQAISSLIELINNKFEELE